MPLFPVRILFIDFLLVIESSLEVLLLLLLCTSGSSTIGAGAGATGAKVTGATVIIAGAEIAALGISWHSQLSLMNEAVLRHSPACTSPFRPFSSKSPQAIASLSGIGAMAFAFPTCCPLPQTLQGGHGPNTAGIDSHSQVSSINIGSNAHWLSENCPLAPLSWISAQAKTLDRPGKLTTAASFPTCLASPQTLQTALVPAVVGVSPTGRRVLLSWH